LSPKSAEDGRRASEPATIEPLPSPLHTGIVRAGSTFNVAVRSRSRSSNRANDPLGLTVVHQPETSPSLDIIFVHGLGGTSRATWSKDRDPDYFWPERWLPTEPAIRHARILSFGYNANFAQTGSTPITGIVDFAKDLLYAMKFAKDGELNELELGNRPIIFIVHSMGGLVVKQVSFLAQSSI
jgi:pimeloyl-ACP methyl ester carboxylesterase